MTKKTKKKPSPWQEESATFRARALVNATEPLLELFALVDDVFTEDDAMSPEKRQIGMGRIYEQWKRTRAALDPTWDASATNRQRMGRPWKRRGERQHAEIEALLVQRQLGSGQDHPGPCRPLWRGYWDD